GFLNKEVLQQISKIGLNIVIRCPKSRMLNLENNQIKAKDIFKDCYNGEFYYYHKLRKFLNDRNAYLYNVKGKLVSVCNNKECLLNKTFFFIFSTNLEYTATQIFKIYKLRWKIESFFKILKSYLSLSVLNRNNIDYVDQRINLSLSGFFIVQEMASEIKTSFYQTLKLLQDGKLIDLFEKSFKSSCKYFSYFVLDL
ncbi:MAG: transposase, partial [Candidatus Dojkabacteria bacterium]|nr:transposase [Candidatus Dojkabacteria bacterium]